MKQSLLAAFLAVLGGAAAADGARAEAITLRIGGGHAAAVPYITQTRDFFVPEVRSRVAARTQHTVRFIEAYGGTVAKLGEELEAVQRGLLDLGQMCFCFEPSKAFALNLNYYVPFTTPSVVQQLRATRRVFGEFPEITGRFEQSYGQRVLALTGYDSYHLATRFEWTNVAELRGRKIGGAGPNLPWLSHTGAVVVQSSLSEFYNSMSSGVFEGALLFPASYAGLRIYEVAPHFKLIDIGSVVVNGLTLNARTAARLPPEVLAIIEEVAREYEQRVAEVLDQLQRTGLETARANGARISTIDPAQRIAWAEALRRWPNEMAQEMTRQGYRGGDIFRAYIASLQTEGYSPPIAYPID